MLKAHWSLIAYDVRCPRRLQKLHRFLRTEAYALQESVFAWFGTDEEKLILQARMLKFIDKEVDDLRGYRLKSGSSIQLWGSSPFVTDVFDSGYPPHHLNRQQNDDSDHIFNDDDVAA